MKVLVIEDESQLRRTVVNYLSTEGYFVESASSFNEALERIALYDYDCYLIDITLPGGSGLDLLTQIKTKNSKSGMIILSAKGSIDDKIQGLNLGADDYLPKPFHLQELNARIRSVIRRRNFDGKNEIIFNEITLIPDSRQVFVNSLEVFTTGKEFDILVFLLINKNRVLPKESIASHIWGDYVEQSNSLDFLYTHIKNLRKKLILAGAIDYIKSVYGIGYKLVD